MKKFLIIGNMGAVTYKEVFPHIKNGEIWWGNSVYNGDMIFKVPEFYPLEAMWWNIDEEGNRFIRVSGVRWFTNLIKKPFKALSLTKQYNPSDYPKYDNYNAINVDRLKDIPYDYNGTMGVPITILQYLNSDGTIDKKFKIVGKMNHPKDPYDFGKATVNNKEKYTRILIQKI